MEAYLLHDANAGSNLKLMIMIQEEGMKGYGIYWTVLEFLRLQNEYKASLKVIPILIIGKTKCDRCKKRNARIKV